MCEYYRVMCRTVQASVSWLLEYFLFYFGKLVREDEVNTNG